MLSYRNPLFLCLFLLSVLKKTFAQAPFAQINQTPLLLNSSLAGSKEKKRIGLGWNTVRKEIEKRDNYFISYDQVMRKWGSGVGVYYLHQNFRHDQGATPIPKGITTPYQYNYQINLAGIVIAPKFNVMNCSQPTKIQYTFSPSLLFEYANSVAYQNDRFYSNDYYSTLYSVNHPHGLKIKDSTLYSFDRYKTQANYYRIGLGLLYNTENIVMHYQFRYINAQFKNTGAERSFNDISQQSKIKTSSISYFSMNGIEQTLNVGITFPKKKGSVFSFTPMIGAGYFFPLFTQADVIFPTRWHYGHASANFRIAKVLLGAAYTQYSTSYYGGTLGYQFPWLKLMSTWNMGLGSQRLFYSEITANVTF